MGKAISNKHRKPSGRTVLRAIGVLPLLILAPTQSRAADPFEIRGGGTLEVYGQLSPAYLGFDDGAVRTTRFVDNSNSNSRIGIWYRQPIFRGRFNFNFETAIGFRGSNSVSQSGSLDRWDWSKSNIRKLEAIWETERIGTFYVGQGSMASDGIATQDLSGTSIVSYVGIPDTAGAFFLRTAAGPLSAVTVAAAFPNFDGGRRARVRYDSPDYRGLVLSASAGKQVTTDVAQTQDSDITLRYSHDGRLFRVSAAGGYTWINRKVLENNRTFVGSFSIEHKATGISFTTSSGSRDTTGSYRYFKLGYKAQLPRVGPFSVSVDYYGGSHMVTGGSRSESYGFGILQRFANPRIEAYLGLRSYKYSDPSPVRYQKAHSVFFGGRWKF